MLLAKWTELAYIPQAAEFLARDSLRVPSTPPIASKRRTLFVFFLIMWRSFIGRTWFVSSVREILEPSRQGRTKRFQLGDPLLLLIDHLVQRFDQVFLARNFDFDLDQAVFTYHSGSPKSYDIGGLPGPRQHPSYSMALPCLLRISNPRRDSDKPCLSSLNYVRERTDNIAFRA